MSNKGNPHFSVVIPLYNKRNYVSATIRSVLEQSFGDFELIVVDDGSQDGSSEVVSRIPDIRLRLLVKPNGGESSARNHGIAHARAGMIAFLDADDLWDCDYLEEIKKLIDEYPAAGGYCAMIRDSQHGPPRIPKRKWLVDRRGNKGMVEDYIGCLSSGFFPVTSSSVCIKREVFTDVGLFNERLAIGPDLDMWLRVYLHSGIAASESVLATYRTDAENRSVARPDFDRREIDFFRHLYLKYDQRSLSESQFHAMRDWISRRLAQVVRRQASLGHKMSAWGVALENANYMKPVDLAKAVLRIIAPNVIVRRLRNL